MDKRRILEPQSKREEVFERIQQDPKFWEWVFFCQNAFEKGGAVERLLKHYNEIKKNKNPCLICDTLVAELEALLPEEKGNA